MKEIKLSNISNKSVKIDDEDFGRVTKYSWYLHAKGIAIQARINNRLVYLNRFILNYDDRHTVDHKNLDIFDCQKKNLRIATKSENAANRPKNKNNTTGYKGVIIQKGTGKFLARIQVNYRYIHLGTFLTKESAARAYNKAAIKYFGEFAYLNEGV